MGGICPCFSSDRRTPETRMINHHMAVDQEQDAITTKLLLLGIGEVGKTTFFRQFQLLYGEGIDDDKRTEYRHQIHIQCISQMRRLAEACNKYGETPEYPHLQLSHQGKEALSRLTRTAPDDMTLTTEIAQVIGILWKEDGIKSGCDLGSKLAIAQSSGYFWDHIDQIAQRSYMPSNHECVLLRTPSTGVDEVTFRHSNAQDSLFQVVDVGGQRSERRKWIKVFDESNAIIWVASLSAYDEVLYEDATAPAMSEQLRLFKETVNLKNFINTPVLLFLNKSDIFREKLEFVPLKTCFPDYDGENKFDEAAAYVKNKFREQDDNSGRQFYHHVTCATNKDNVENVFKDVTIAIVFENTAYTGIL